MFWCVLTRSSSQRGHLSGCGPLVRRGILENELLPSEIVEEEELGSRALSPQWEAQCVTSSTGQAAQEASERQLPSFCEQFHGTWFAEMRPAMASRYKRKENHGKSALRIFFVRLGWHSVLYWGCILIETERWRHLATSTTHDTDLPLAVLERAQDVAGNQVAARNASLIGLVLCFCCSHFVPESQNIPSCCQNSRAADASVVSAKVTWKQCQQQNCWWSNDNRHANIPSIFCPISTCSYWLKHVHI